MSLGTIWFKSPISFKASHNVLAFDLKSYSVEQIVFILFSTSLLAYFFKSAPIAIPSLKSLSKFVSLRSSSKT